MFSHSPEERREWLLHLDKLLAQLEDEIRKFPWQHESLSKISKQIKDVIDSYKRPIE